MAAILESLTPVEAAQRLGEKRAILVDVREADEYARVHIADAINIPLSRWEAGHFTATPEQDVIFTCRSGMRTQSACDRLVSRVNGAAYVLAGGVEGWQRAGLPVTIDAKAPLEIMRQVQIVAGSLVLIGVLLGTFVAPGFYGLSAFVGAGLLFAGVTGFCGMAKLLAVMPWNKRSPATATAA